MLHPKKPYFTIPQFVIFSLFPHETFLMSDDFHTSSPKSTKSSSKAGSLNKCADYLCLLRWQAILTRGANPLPLLLWRRFCLHPSSNGRHYLSPISVSVVNDKLFYWWDSFWVDLTTWKHDLLTLPRTPTGPPFQLLKYSCCWRTRCTSEGL